MKRAVCLLMLVAACSHGATKAAPTPTATPSPTPVVSEGPRPTATRTATPTHAPVAVGPVGTKVPAGFTPMSATFVSDRTGWVLGSSPCPTGTGRCDVIARTRDGGATWRAIPSPRTSPDSLAQIRFADERNGFITGDRLWATHDGGATWKAVRTADGELAAASGRAWLTVDGRLYSAPVTGGAFALEAAGSRVQTLTVHGDTAYYSDGTGLFALRHGAAPHRISVPCASGTAPVVGLGSASVWVLVCEGDAGLGHQDKQAFVTRSAGQSWTALPDPPSLSGSDVYETDGNAFVIDHQEVAVSRNGGAWTTALRTDGGVVEGGFESTSLGYCIGGFGDSTDTSMRVSHDAGRSWKAVAF